MRKAEGATVATGPTQAVAVLAATTDLPDGVDSGQRPTHFSGAVKVSGSGKLQ